MNGVYQMEITKITNTGNNTKLMLVTLRHITSLIATHSKRLSVMSLKQIKCSKRETNIFQTNPSFLNVKGNVILIIH